MKSSLKESMKPLFVIFSLLFSQTLMAQKNLGFDLYSPDTVRYDIVIKKDSAGKVSAKVDFGTFNFKEEPTVNFYARPYAHPFILDNSLWNSAYLKPSYDKRLTILPGNSDKVITFKYISKYNNYFKSSFEQNTWANSNHGRINFDIKGQFLPPYIQFSKAAGYHAEAAKGKPVADTLVISNKGKAVINIQNVVYGQGVEMQKEKTQKIQIGPGAKKKMIFNYTPAQNGRFSEKIMIVYSQAYGHKTDTAYYKIRGYVK